LDPELEKTRINRETRERDSDRYVKKSGPFYNPEFDNDLKKISLQTGIVTPSQVGIELEKKKNGEKSLLDIKNDAINTKKLEPINSTPTGVSGQGRPRNSKDTEQRKTRQFSPRTGAALKVWTLDAIDQINDLLNPEFLDFYAKKNMRSLSSVEYQECEETKSKILFSIEPYSKIDSDTLNKAISEVNNTQTQQIYQIYANSIKTTLSEINRQLTAEELKMIKVDCYYQFFNK
jgi:hypothetical protein